ncbi:PH domain-like protein [Macrolepiota fuliginosa MF-IS2]|uniref:PH domain-like protein n=1 Tax=Macrolepiota fuliginosa MF-IS2 TaxID=1400762 RepID=A0A9P6C853_9AGAR|nr:PH domain-like protein [Macrolepiota fuliginosa MF-IS2]
MPPSAAPPTPQEIQRKLSVHSATRIKPPTGPVSGTESDSDSILTPDVVSGFVSASYHATSSSMPPPLSSIAERSTASGGEDSDEEEEEIDGSGWRGGGDAASRIPRAIDTTIKSGYLSKKGERRKTWKKRWFVLRPSHLAFYKNEAEYKLLRLLDLGDVHSCVPVQLKRHDNAFGLILPKRTYYLQAGSAADVQAWVQAIEEARQTLMATSTQNSTSSTPISIPINPTVGTGTTVLRPSPLSVSPPSPGRFSQMVSSSDSEDALAPPPPLPAAEGGGLRGLTVTPSPTNVTFSAAKPPPSPVPAHKEASKVILSGYLMKCGSKRRNWRKRWFVLTADRFFYSRSHMDTKPHRVFSFSDILDAMDYDLPQHRHGHGHQHQHQHQHHHHPAAVLAPSLSSPPSHSNVLGGVAVGVPGVGSDLSETQQQRNFTFKIVMTKRNLLLCAPSEEDEIRWLGAVRALIARRSGSGVLPGQQQQQTPGAVVGGDGGGGGIKNKVRRLSVGAGVLTGSKSASGDDGH